MEVDYSATAPAADQEAAAPAADQETAARPAGAVITDEDYGEKPEAEETPESIALANSCDKIPVTGIPPSRYCPTHKNIRNIVEGGDRVDISKSRKAKMPSATQSKNWGAGMACAGTSKKCTIVPSNFFGPIPGIEVGQSWKFRAQVAEDGVHRPIVAGIAGTRNKGGCVSIVLAAGYPEDVDNGDEFLYTGSGGRELKTGNRRTAPQTSDQQLTRMNEALAFCCKAPLNAKKGGDAKGAWREGKPIRVVRSSKALTHHKDSPYPPKVGNRYDGIYKVVRYWQEAGATGFKVWRYLMRRDDTTPAPWTKEGAELIKKKGLKIVEGPNKSKENSEEAAEGAEGEEGEEGEEENEDEEEGDTKGKGKGTAKAKPKAKSTGKKRAADDDDEEPVASGFASGSSKKKKVEFKLDNDLVKLIKADSIASGGIPSNARAWGDVMEAVKNGSVENVRDLMLKVEEAFTCTVCLELVKDPVTTLCQHNACKECISRACKSTTEENSCPNCRSPLAGPDGATQSLPVNARLVAAFKKLMPAYASTGKGSVRVASAKPKPKTT
ncbi:PUA-like domain-containing protein [Blyttiomyces helicus]|uniref:PUA-like domain-containing protein n=1 Tax=Blyttiomyces helicus TaxID=388810 RepID=A0A4P9VZS9_9FUNG|nr:PUA-like domain-containing protein [Blyttiomyces helicus]|eukprot:RKO85294.1 PUA-like domain-containing protein [Blyttiomyces helicus]